MIRKMERRGLRRKVSEEIYLTREGIEGNDDKKNKGNLWGVLREDNEGFYVDVYRIIKNGEEHMLDRTRFKDEPHRLRNYDVVQFLTPRRKTFGKEYTIRL